MSDYKMNQYDLQSYFKSLCNSFYIAYEQVKRLEKEESKYITYKYSLEELQQREQLEDKKREYDREIEELNKIREKLNGIRSYWVDNMWQDFEAIKSVLYTIQGYGFSIIITTKAEIYALIRFFYGRKVKQYPIINIEKEYRKAFSDGEELYDDFIFAYEEALDKNGVPDTMNLLYDKYF